MKKGSEKLGRQSSSTEVAAIQSCVPLARPPAKENGNTRIVIDKNPLYRNKKKEAQESPQSCLRRENSFLEQREVSKFMSSTRTILEEERKQRLAADPSSHNASVKTTFEMEYDPSCESRAGATNWKKTLCVSAFIILTIAASTALQVRLFITKKSCDKDDSQPTALLSFVLLTLCAGMCDVLLQASMPSSSVLPKTRRALNLVPIALFLLATSAIDDTKPASETCATFTYAADTGGCKHFDVSTMNDFWKKRCGFANQPTSHIFINTEVRNKYGFDPGTTATSYELARNVASIATMANALVVKPIDVDTGMSLTDYALCLSFYTPCSASCIPRRVCPSSTKQVLAESDDDILKGLAYYDCKNLGIPLDLLSLAGLEKSLENAVVDFLDGMSASCADAFSLIFQNTSLASDTVPCASPLNYTKSYGFEGGVIGNCSAATWEREKSDFEEEMLKQKQLVEEWEHRMQGAVYAAHSILILIVLFSTALYLKSPTDAPSLLAYQTISAIICCVLLHLFGVVILYICLVHFVELPSSRGYVYIFASIGCFSIWQCLVLLLLPGKFVRKIKTSNSLVRSKRQIRCLQKLSRIFEAIAKTRRYVKEHFGVAGSGFLVKAISLELLEISLQSLALFRNAASEDIMLAMATCTLLLFNCVFSPIAYAFEKKDAVIVLDGLFDIGYTIINAIRINEQKASIDAINALALMLPICSIVDIMCSYAQYSIREKGRRGERLVPTKIRSRQGSLLFRLPNKNAGSCEKEAPMFKGAYRVLQLLLTASALTFGAFSGYTLSRCVTKHIECLDKYSSCLWKGVWPRKYYINGSIFDRMTCGEEYVESIDGWNCKDASDDFDISDIEFEPFLRLTDLRLGDVVFPKSLARLMELPRAAMSKTSEYAKVRVRNLQDELDLSNLGIKAVPRVLAEMLEAYIGRNVKHIDLSGNWWSEPQIRALLSVIDCKRKSSRFCSLASIDLSENKLENVPSTLLDNETAFPSLSYIDIGGNKLNGMNAVLMRRMAGSDDFRVNLERNPVTAITAASTDLGSKSFDEFIRWAGTFVNMSHIITFNIVDCDMGGNIVSNALLKMPNLEKFALLSNPMEGTLPSEVGLLTQLTWLNLYNNGFNGTIPSQLGQLTKLTRLDLEVNNFTGTMPSQLGQLTNLKNLYLYKNAPSFNRTIPREVQALRPYPLKDLRV